MNISRLPALDPKVLNGDPLEYTAWFNSFQTLISTSNIPDTESIFYLQKYLSQLARDSVAGFLSQCTSDLYQVALTLLKEIFGLTICTLIPEFLFQFSYVCTCVVRCLTLSDEACNVCLKFLKKQSHLRKQCRICLKSFM